MQTLLQPYVVRSGQGRSIEAFGQRFKVLISSEQTGGKFTVAHAEIPAQNGPPPHIHGAEDELFFIVRGQFEYWINGQTFQVEAGDVVYGPREVPHTFKNIGEDTGELYVVTIDGEFESFFSACSEAQIAGAPMETILEIAAKHNISFCDPQIAGPNSSSDGATPKIVRTGEGEVITAFGDTIRVLVNGNDTGKAFSCGIVETPSCSGPPLHVHEREDEMFWIEQGIYDVRIGDERFQLHPGDLFFAPHGIPHAFRVVSDEPGRMVGLVTPSGFENFFTQCAQMFAQGQATPSALGIVAKEHGITFLPPQI